MAKGRELIDQSANQILARLKRGEVTPHDLLDALEARIAAVDGAVNALPILCFDRARAHADRLMAMPMERRGRLAGIPVPIKDLVNVAGVRSTQGSPIFADFVPEASNLLVERLEAEGGIVYAKSNTPEFGAGGNTFNEVFGATLNPWNTARSAAGSSGGAAVALATGQAWLAHGSDTGGSLRNPASFCGIVGLRPSPGRVATAPGLRIDRTLPVQGPMARTVADCALLLDAMSGEDHRDPISLPRSPASFLTAANAPALPKRVAYSPDLGITPVDPEVAAITRRVAERLAAAGVIVEEAHPDFSEAHEAFGVMRAYHFATAMAALLKAHPTKFKPEIVWNIEKGMALTMDDLVRAEHARARMLQSTLKFFETYDLLLTPATIVAAYPVEERYVARVGDVEFPDYVQWLSIAYAITMVSCPALSLPCGFTAEGLPVGLQIAARPHGEAAIFSAAAAIEQMLALNTLRPIDPRPGV